MSQDKHKYWLKQIGLRVYPVSWQGWLWVLAIFVLSGGAVFLGHYFDVFESRFLSWLLFFCMPCLLILPITDKIKPDS